MGQILEIKCHNCSEIKHISVGGGMEFSITKIYHCPICEFLKTQEFYDYSNPFNADYDENKPSNMQDLLNAKQMCPKCKLEKKDTVLNAIHENDIESLKCYQCKKKELKISIVGHWD